MRKTLKRFICYILILACMAGITGCGYLPSREEQLGVLQQAKLPVPEATPEAVTPAPVIKGMEEIPLVISEVMNSNRSTLAAADGSFPDWIELCNAGDAEIELYGYRLAFDAADYALPDISLQPGEYLLIFCDDADSTDSELHSGFKLPKEGGTAAILYADGTAMTTFAVGEPGRDISCGPDSEGNSVSYSFPTPGYENTPAGYAAFQSSLAATGPLEIYEVMTFNADLLYQDGEYHDWVELKNIGTTSINLGDYYLSDKESNRALYRLPEVTLGINETYIVYCTGDPEAKIYDGGNAPFELNAGRDQLFLSTADGTLIDYCSLHDLKYGGSMGRIDGEDGYFYFEEATPKELNKGGARSIAPSPVLEQGYTDGVYNGVECVSVALAGSGDIYFTTDGSTPTTASEKYKGPFDVMQTTVVRAVSIIDGTLPSDTLDLSYILNENHTLPVVSLVCDPDSLFAAQGGIYANPTQRWEKEGSIALFDGDEGFQIQCGIKLHGLSSRTEQNKKSFKIMFKDRFEGNLQYDLFGNGVTTFASVLLRAAQEDYYSTMMRDSLMHDLAQECFPELSSQDHKYSVLYINGEYWGIYNIREAHSTDHFANHYGLDADTIVHTEETWGGESEFAQVYNFATTNSMSDDANYQQVAEHLNINSVIGWCIIEAYCGNMDCHSPNMRFYWQTQEKILNYALVDVDLGFFESWRSFDVPFEYGYAYNTLADVLSANGGFREEFLTQLSAALTGPMSNENVLALIDSYENLLINEVPRDRERWGSTTERWQAMVNDLRTFVTKDGGRAKVMVNVISNRFSITQETKNRFFADVQ